MKFARELISGVAINVPVVSAIRAKENGIPLLGELYRDSWENYGIKYLVTEAISTEGSGFDVAHKGERRTASFRLG